MKPLKFRTLTILLAVFGLNLLLAGCYVTDHPGHDDRDHHDEHHDDHHDDDHR